MSILGYKGSKRIGYITLEAINHFLKPAFTSLLSLIVIRFSGEEVWGLFVPLLISIELLMTFLNWGQKPYLLRAFSLESAGISNAWYTALIARTILVIPAVLILFFLNLSPFVMALCALWILPRFFNQSLDPIIQYNRKYSVAIVSEVFSILVSCAILFIRSEIGLYTILYAVISGQLIKGVILSRIVPSLDGLKIHQGTLTHYIIKAFPFVSLSLIGLIQAKVDLYIVAWLLPASDAAFYQVLSGFLVILQTVAFIVLAPFVKNIYRMNSSTLIKLKLKYTGIGLAITIVGSLIIAVVLQWLYLFEIKWVIIPLIMVYILPLFLYLIESQILLKHHQEGKLLAATSLSAIAGFIGCFFLIPEMGIIGALLGGIIARLVIVGMVLLFAKKHINAQG